MSDPILFIGGSLDGTRRVFEDAPWHLYLPILPECSASTVGSQVTPTKEALDIEIYHRVSLNATDDRIYLYIHDGLKGNEWVRRLLGGYKAGYSNCRTIGRRPQ